MWMYLTGGDTDSESLNTDKLKLFTMIILRVAEAKVL
jgi:hypothetical protein